MPMCLRLRSGRLARAGLAAEIVEALAACRIDKSMREIDLMALDADAGEDHNLARSRRACGRVRPLRALPELNHGAHATSPEIEPAFSPPVRERRLHHPDGAN
jgi:hypothetical protein